MFIVDILLLLLSAVSGARPDAEVSRVATLTAEAHALKHDLSGYPSACGIGQVIAVGYTTVGDVITAWQQSFYHELIIDAGWSRIGGGAFGDYIVIVFLRDC